MLKIKDNVDLKKLEKFGFELQPSYILCCDTLFNGDTEVFTDKTIHYSSFNSECELDILYDLITAWLVEKVEE